MEKEKKDTLDIFLKINALSLLDNNYPESEWIRLYNDGSKMNDGAGTGVHSRLLSQYVPMGKYLTNFDAQVHAIFLAVTNLQFRKESFEKAVIFDYFRSAIETIALQHLSESLIVI
ncbi:hypothetical protein NPIL_445281 [Nephila pilipes]|uniref:Uncharacterized protein n=1 Tax=Nephila pilipes TaxID=299642 RepID=A0A8X6U6E8_NEPPI|nr:hypothetical protein NPIL_445281 [Nephila pilipes]